MIDRPSKVAAICAMALSVMILGAGPMLIFIGATAGVTECILWNLYFLLMTTLELIATIRHYRN